MKEAMRRVYSDWKDGVVESQLKNGKAPSELFVDLRMSNLKPVILR
jgi:hypothetical protein